MFPPGPSKKIWLISKPLWVLIIGFLKAGEQLNRFNHAYVAQIVEKETGNLHDHRDQIYAMYRCWQVWKSPQKANHKKFSENKLLGRLQFNFCTKKSSTDPLLCDNENIRIRKKNWK